MLARNLNRDLSRFAERSRLAAARGFGGEGCGATAGGTPRLPWSRFRYWSERRISHFDAYRRAISGGLTGKKLFRGKKSARDAPFIYMGAKVFALKRVSMLSSATQNGAVRDISVSSRLAPGGSPPSGPPWSRRREEGLPEEPPSRAGRAEDVAGEDVPAAFGLLEEVAFPVVVGDEGNALRIGCGRFGHGARLPGQCCRAATLALVRVRSVVKLTVDDVALWSRERVFPWPSRRVVQHVRPTSANDRDVCTCNFMEYSIEHGELPS